MKKKNILYITAILISTFFLSDSSFATETMMEEKSFYRVVFIDAHEGVGEKTLVAEPGTTVTWINWTNVQAEIHFLDKKVVDATDCPECFSIAEEGTYDSVSMSLNATASLHFLKKGKYEYIVKEEPEHFWERVKAYRGTIWIK